MGTSTKGNTGLIYIFTGDGKGKTSATLGVAMRAAGQGKRTAMVQWYKESSKFKVQSSKLRKVSVRKPGWTIGEHELPELLKKPLFEIYPMGQGFYKLPTDHAGEEEHRQAAHEALQLAEKLLIRASKGPTLPSKVGPYQNRNQNLFLLVLDEALNAVHDGLIDLIDLIDLISKRGETHIILTGRRAPKKLIALADLVTEMKNIKHHFDKGKKAVLGLDF